MIKSKFLCVTLLLCLQINFIKAQNISRVNNHWIFGNSNHLNFVTDPPTTSVLPIALDNIEQSCAIADGTGNLLFYVGTPASNTTQMNVYDANNNVMPNGSGIMGDYSSTMGALIIQMPGNCNKYYIFYTSVSGHLRYSVVDITANSGNGDVIAVQKNILIYANGSEKMLAAQKGTREDYWIITRNNNSGTSNADIFLAFEVTSAGVNTTPVVSTFSNFQGAGNNVNGWMCFNDDYTKIADASNQNCEFNTYNFNSLTGIVSGKTTIYQPSLSPFMPTFNFGACWTGGVLYFTFFDAVSANMILRRYDIATSPSGAIFSDINTGVAAGLASLQKKNTKMYMNKTNTNFLHVVNDPGIYSTPNFVNSGLALSALAQYGIANYFYYYDAQLFNSGDLMTPGRSQQICYNTSTILGGAADSADAIYFWQGQISTVAGWSPLSPTYLVNPNVTNPTTINLTSATTRFILTLISPCGDTIYSDKEFVFVDSLSTPSITGNINYCAGDPITSLTSTSPYSGSGIINWYSDLALTSLVGTGINFTPLNTPGATTYYVVEQEGASVAPQICTSLITPVTVTISPGIALCYTKQAARWDFGSRISLNFLCSSPPSHSDDSQVNTPDMESGCSMADVNGNLLFYAFANRIRNNAHQIMPNGNGLLSDVSASQGFLAIPNPTNTNRYYLFAIGSGAGGLSYSEVDMLLDGGKGDIIVATKNTLLQANVREQMTAVENCDGTGTWLIVHTSLQMFAYLVTASGIAAPVISNVPLVAIKGGQLMASPTGRHIAYAADNDLCELYTFDNETGKVCHKETMVTRGYGCSFSNNGQYLYTNGYFTGIYQLDVLAANIAASAVQIYDPFVSGIFIYGQMQLAPDCKLYVFGWNSSLGSYIEFPNNPGLTCNLQANSFSITDSSFMTQYGIPQFIQSWFKDPTYVEPVIAANFTFSPTTVCLPSPITFSNSSTTIGDCPPYLWNFGDAASGASNTSTLTSPSHIFSSPGTYSVTLTLTERCQTSIKIIPITVYGAPIVTIIADTTVCENFGVTLNTSSIGTYLWTGPSGNMTGIFTSTLQNPTNPIFLGDGFANEGWYYLTVTNAGGCSATDSIYITILAVPSPSIASSILNCVQTLTGSVGTSNGPIVTYAWGPGGGNSLGTTSVINLPPGYLGPQVVFTVTDTEGCSAGAIMLAGPLVPPAAPTASVTVQPTCTTPTGTIVVSAPLGATIQYSNGGAYQVGTTFSGLAPGNYNITAQNMTTGCISTVTVLTVNAIPTAPIAIIIADTTICDQNLVTLSTPSIGTYLWTGPGFGGGFSSTLQNPTNPLHLGLNFFNEGWYYLTVTNAAGCSSTDSVYITILAPPDPFYLDSIANCQDIFTVGVFSSNGPIVSYVWGPIALGTDSVVTVPFGYSGPINCILTDSEGCGQGIIWSTTPPVPPTAPIIGTITQPTCTTPTGTIVVASPLGATIQYSNGGAYQVGTTFSGLAPGNYNITTQDMTTGCISTITALTVNAISTAPAAPIIYTPNSWYCIGDNITALNSSSGTHWYSDAGLSNQVGTGASFTPPSIVGITTYYVINNTSGCISASASVDVEFTNCTSTCTSNLITNGSFENYSSCPSNTGQLSNATGWLGNGDYYNTVCFGYYNSPMYYPYFDINNYNLGLNGGGTFPPPTGDGYAGIILGGTFFKGFMVQQVNLGCSMEYTLEFKATTPRSDNAPDNTLCVYGSNVAPPYNGCDPNLTLLGCLTNPSAVDNYWKPQSITFTPTTDFSYMILTGQCPTNTGNGGTVLIDDVVLCGTCVNPPVVNSVNEISPESCSGNDGEIDATITTCSSTISYEWENAINPGVVISTTANTTGLQVGTYQVTITDFVGCTGSNNGALSFAGSTTNTITYNGSPFCTSSTSATVTLTGVSGGSYSAPAGLNINSTTGTINPSLSTPATYTVTYDDGSCITTTSVTISPAPSTTINYSGSPFCSTSTTGAVVITGTTGGTFSSTAGLNINPVTGQINSSLSTPNTYLVSYTIPASGSCAAFVATTNVTITAAPSATINYVGSPFCATVGNVNVTLTGSSGGTYSSTVGLSINPATGAINTSTSTPGVYTITYTIAASAPCGQVVTTTNITITAAPSATINYSGSPFCNNTASANVTLVGTTGGTFSSTAGLIINSTTGVINPVLSTPGIYTITYTIAASGGCNALAATTMITITNNPSASINYGASAFCENSGSIPVNLNGTAGGTFSSSGGLSLNTSTGTIDPTLSTSGNYIITYSIPASNGCPAFTTTQNISISSMPIPTITGDTIICDGESITLLGGVIGTYEWSDGSTGSTLTFTPSTSQIITLVVTNGACIDSTSVNITVNPAPGAFAAANPSIIYLGDSTNLQVVSSGNSILWSPLATVDCGNCANTYAHPETTTTYIVEVTGSNGCKSYDTVVVEVDILCGDIYIPEAFSPNNDSNNNAWCIYGNCITAIDVSIFDRWGSKVFNSIIPGECWNGFVRDKLADTDVFIYQATVTLLSGEILELNGSIHLMK